MADSVNGTGTGRSLVADGSYKEAVSTEMGSLDPKIIESIKSDLASSEDESELSGNRFKSRAYLAETLVENVHTLLGAVEKAGQAEDLATALRELRHASTRELSEDGEDWDLRRARERADEVLEVFGRQMVLPSGAEEPSIG